MSDTLRMQMPLLDAAQAQKHVTINEALLRADALAARRVESRILSTPPAFPVDGSAWIVGSGATDAWAGQDRQIAIWLNGGWAFIAPWNGLRLWVEDEASTALFHGAAWVDAALGVSTHGAATALRVIEIDHVLSNATVSTTVPVIPDKAIVLGVTGRVTESISGAASWSLGVPGSANRYGETIGIAAGSFVRGVTGQPQAYYGDTALEITSDGPAFTAGSVRLAVHCMEISAPAL